MQPFVKPSRWSLPKGSDYAWKIEDGFLYVQRFEEKIYNLDYLDMSAGTDIDIGGDMLASSVEMPVSSANFRLSPNAAPK
jgi:hypothetical protein